MKLQPVVERLSQGESDLHRNDHERLVSNLLMPFDISDAVYFSLVELDKCLH